MGDVALRAGTAHRIRRLPGNRRRRRRARAGRPPGLPGDVRSVAGGARAGLDGAADRQPDGRAARGVWGTPGGVGPRAVRAGAGGRRLQGAGPVGSMLVLGGHPYDVVGVVDDRTMDGGVPIVYMPLATCSRPSPGAGRSITAVAMQGTPANVPDGLVVLTPSSGDHGHRDGPGVPCRLHRQHPLADVAHRRGHRRLHALRRRPGAEARLRRAQGARLLVACAVPQPRPRSRRRHAARGRPGGDPARLHGARSSPSRSTSRPTPASRCRSWR